MSEDRGLSGRLLTALVIVLSLAGLVYFGIRAVSQKIHSGGDNPFAYDIESYRRSGADRVRYTETAALTIPLPQVAALALGPDGAVYVSGGERILRLDGDGRVRSRFEASGRVRCLAVDAAGIYAGLTDRVELISPDGVLESLWDAPGERSIFTSIALSRDFIFLADAGSRVVWRLGRSGGDPLRIGERDDDRDIPGFVIPSPYFDVALDPDGFLWAANTGRHSLENYTLEGGFRSSWGEAAMTIEGFCGCCNPSHIAIREDGAFVTSEKGLCRVKVHDATGALLAVVAGPDAFEPDTVNMDLAVDGKDRVLVLDPKRKQVRIFVEKQRGAAK